ncbi:multi-copper-oxidase laccase-like protein [Melampsora americana]|nr:multi-copper-oxidase laccase-like protein [Melampsora americana]
MSSNCKNPLRRRFYKSILLFLGFFHLFFQVVHCGTKWIADAPMSQYQLKPNFEICSEKLTRKYEFVITNTTAAPDGFLRSVLAINNQIPGPLIEANEGDSLEITVVNYSGEPLTIHWHGLYQNGTNWEDGPTGITQCPIPVGVSYTYKFNVDNQFGTFWYHAHSLNTMADGIHGPFIVHSPRDPLVRGIDFDEEVVLVLADWYHNTSAQIVHDLFYTDQGYFGTPGTPSPNSVVMNGVGEWDCKYATTEQFCTPTTLLPEFPVVAGNKIRFRLINSGSHSMIFFSADGHEMNVTEADATPVYGPSNVHRLKFHNGQRYSVIVTIDQKEAGSSFYIRASVDTDCWAWVSADLQKTARGIVKVLQPGKTVSSTENQVRPNSNDWSDPANGPCIDLEPDSLTPIIPKSVPSTVTGAGQFANAFGFVSILTGDKVPNPPSQPNNNGSTGNITGSSKALGSVKGSAQNDDIPIILKRQISTGVDISTMSTGPAALPPNYTIVPGLPSIPRKARGAFFVNNVTWATYPYQPILHDLAPGGVGKVNSERVANVVYPTADWYDLYLVNMDAAVAHTYHLHGMDMHIVAIGQGQPTPQNLTNLVYNTKNPLRRDTIAIAPGTYVVARLLADLPGVWAMHCHFGWHLAIGFAGVVVVQPDKIANFEIPDENLELCSHGQRNQREPGRRRSRRSMITKLS